MKSSATCTFLHRSLAALVLIFMVSSCGKDFITTQPEDTTSLSNFYKNDDQVVAGTNALYGSPWFHFNTKFFWAVGDMMSGNAKSYSNDVVQFGNFGITSTDRSQSGSSNTVLDNGWRGLWTIVAQANALINNLPDNVGSAVDEATLNQALGEAHVMRAEAYFFLVRLWGPIPIIKNNLDHVYDAKVPRYKVDDIYQFIDNDLQYGIDHCRNISQGLYRRGHVTSGSAKALLSKVYMFQHDYQKAQQMSQQVIQSGEFHLLDNYSNLFLTSYNNNPETIIAEQWKGPDYGNGNAIQASFAYNTTITGTGAGYAVVGPTISLQNAYEQGDNRLKPTIMLPGYHYDSILQSQGGYTAPDDISAQTTDAAPKKYVVGTPSDNGGQGGKQSMPDNTYLLRYADVLLVNAEAAFRNGDTGQALTSLNKVRERAGLQDLSSVSLDQILHERRIEFALEGQYWYTLTRLDRQKAIQMISNQERGGYDNAPKESPPVINTLMVTPDDSDFLLPYPETDFANDQFLHMAPQSYDFGDNNSNDNQ